MFKLSKEATYLNKFIILHEQNEGFEFRSNILSDDISSNSIPMFVQLTEDEKSFVIEKLNYFAKTI